MSKKEELLVEYSQWLRMRNYSEQTYKAYMGSIRNFWKFCEKRKGDSQFRKDNAVQTYLSYRLTVEKRNYSTVNGDYSALQWFYKYVLDREWNVRKLIRPRKEKTLPRYMTPEQVGLLLENTSCAKHRLMMLMYYCTNAWSSYRSENDSMGICVGSTQSRVARMGDRPCFATFLCDDTFKEWNGCCGITEVVGTQKVIDDDTVFTFDYQTLPKRL